MNKKSKWRVISSSLPFFFLTACGGGDSAPVQCVVSVTSGFIGNIEATYPEGKGGPGLGHDGDGDGGNSAGVGGGLGKTLGASVLVTRIVDGSVVGEARTDDKNGLVTLNTCGSAEPLLVTLKGAPGAKYYDEGKNAFVDFGADEVLHALVNDLSENIGVSPFTEAAYRYAINNYVVDPAQVRNGSIRLKETGDVTNLAIDKIITANNTVLAALNSKLPRAYHLQSLKALPTPIQRDSGTDSVPTSNYGRAAVVTGGFVRMAAQFQLDANLPALQATKQLARDLTDGNINGFALDGTAASDDALPLYDSVRLPISLSVGSNSVAQQFSVTQNFAAAPEKIESIRVWARYPELHGKYCGFDDFATLMKDGTVSLRRQFRIPNSDGGCSIQTTDVERTSGYVVDVKQLIENLFHAQGYLVKTNGDAFSWGLNPCGILGVGRLSGDAVDPTLIVGLRNVTSLSAGHMYAIARDDRGRVYSWGADEYGVLGLGGAVKQAKCQPVEGGVEVGANPSPVQITTLKNIATVYGNEFSAYAVDQDGGVYGWGKGGYSFATGRSDEPDRSIPAPIAGLKGIRSLAFTKDVIFALTRDGKVVGWGSNQFESFGEPGPKTTPQDVPHLQGVNVKEIAASPNYGVFYALRTDGSVLRWGGTNPENPLGTTPADVPNLPVIRHINVNGLEVFFHTEDGQVVVRPITQR
ncbi:MAG: hypothetical protein HY308_09475 [Gammaproteobacteria bacterium]|nr:hypothetical protein [Gammaproteobacteria bacterium]